MVYVFDDFISSVDFHTILLTFSSCRFSICYTESYFSSLLVTLTLFSLSFFCCLLLLPPLGIAGEHTCPTRQFIFTPWGTVARCSCCRAIFATFATSRSVCSNAKNYDNKNKKFSTWEFIGVSFVYLFKFRQVSWWWWESRPTLSSYQLERKPSKEVRNKGRSRNWFNGDCVR